MSEWNDKPFIDYLKAVDEVMETRFGAVTTQRDMDWIAAAQEAGETPQDCAEELHRRCAPLPADNP